MSMGGGSGAGQVTSDINVTPLADVMLVLLIIFMVTATYIVKPSIKVALPEAATGEPTESSSLGLHLTVEGDLFLNGEPTTEETLRATLRSELQRDAEVVCLIAADKEVSHGQVVWLIDLVRQEGISKFHINIDPTMVASVAKESG